MKKFLMLVAVGFVLVLVGCLSEPAVYTDPAETISISID